MRLLSYREKQLSQQPKRHDRLQSNPFHFVAVPLISAGRRRFLSERVEAIFHVLHQPRLRGCCALHACILLALKCIYTIPRMLFLLFFCQETTQHHRERMLGGKPATIAAQTDTLPNWGTSDMKRDGTKKGRILCVWDFIREIPSERSAWLLFLFSCSWMGLVSSCRQAPRKELGALVVLRHHHSERAAKVGRPTTPETTISHPAVEQASEIERPLFSEDTVRD